MKQLILGGARSGKSGLAERLANSTSNDVVYIATSRRDLGDPEMDSRVRHHRLHRPDHWVTVEEPLYLANALENYSQHEVILVDCLTLWVTQCLMEGEGTWRSQKGALLEWTRTYQGQLIFVSNEVGLGVVPMGELSRRFVDETGFLHQSLAATCDRVVFMAAGLPLVMKGPSLPALV